MSKQTTSKQTKWATDLEPPAAAEILGAESLGNPPPQVAATAAGGNDHERTAELNAKTAAYQAKTPADRLESINIADICQTSAAELRAISGIPNGNIGGLQAPRVAGAGVGR
jgi:hypothetical protein